MFYFLIPNEKLNLTKTIVDDLFTTSNTSVQLLYQTLKYFPKPTCQFAHTNCSMLKIFYLRFVFFLENAYSSF